MSEHTQKDDKLIAHIAIYRLDIYRLLSFLFADEKIIKNNIFQSLSNDYCESEVNRLLILTAVVTRQNLDNNRNKYKETGTKECGKFWNNYPAENNRDLGFKKACNMIIHATDIVIKTSEYYYQEEKSNIKNQGEMYFRDKINITGGGKNYAELDLEKFAQHCIELSDKVMEGG